MLKGQKLSYYSYGNYYKSTAEVFYPDSIAQIEELMAIAKNKKRQITVAGSFHSFDNQNSGNDMVVSMKKINYIRYNPDHTIDVGPGATWGDILKEAYKHKCVPFITITGSRPTAGGTLSAHTNTVFTPGLGKEGKYCLEFDLLTPDLGLLTCSRTQNQDLFYGVISGFGLLGFITRIKYKLCYVGSDYLIKISVKNYQDVKELEQRFDLRETPDPVLPEDLKSQSSLFYFDNNKPKFAIFDRHYVKTAQLQQHFNINLYIAAILTVIIRFFPKFANSIMIKDEKREPRKKVILKGLERIYYGTFWAEPDYLWMKYVSKLLKPFGYKPLLYQNSYFIPLAGDQITRFTQKTCELLLKYKLHTSMFDIMYIPKDEPFVLSSSRYTGGFYINTTFFDRTNKESLMKFYSELNHLCLEMNGKMNLVKNLFIETSLLEKMYENEIKEMLVLKKRVDKDNLIMSNFFKEKFPSTFGI